MMKSLMWFVSSAYWVNFKYWLLITGWLHTYWREKIYRNDERWNEFCQ